MDTLLIAIKLIKDGKIKSMSEYLLEIGFLKNKIYGKWSVPLKYIIFFSIAFSG